MQKLRMKLAERIKSLSFPREEIEMGRHGNSLQRWALRNTEAYKEELEKHCGKSSVVGNPGNLPPDQVNF